jgi:hypothetical protein
VDEASGTANAVLPVQPVFLTVSLRISTQAAEDTMDLLMGIGIDLPAFCGFAAACLVSWVWADIVIQSLYNKRFKEMMESNPNLTHSQATQARHSWNRKLDLEFGKRIGRIERIFYIYAVMFDALTLLSAWVILKAFYGWIQKPSVAQSDAPEAEKEITTFYLYIYGNALSLLVALIVAHGGKILANVFDLIFI